MHVEELRVWEGVCVWVHGGGGPKEKRELREGC